MSDFQDYETFRPNMNKQELMEWFQKRLNRQPEAFDIYKVAKEFYQLGAYSRSLLCLQHYVSLPGATLTGRHLLGYCFLNLGEVEKALREFKRCVQEGFHDDWQLVVELIYEMDVKYMNQVDGGGNIVGGDE